jgi:hypothetical protein
MPTAIGEEARGLSSIDKVPRLLQAKERLAREFREVRAPKRR